MFPALTLQLLIAGTGQCFDVALQWRSDHYDYKAEAVQCTKPNAMIDAQTGVVFVSDNDSELLLVGDRVYVLAWPA